MTLKRILAVIAVCLFLPGWALAQANMMGDLVIRSNPEGAEVWLEGESVVSGLTPARFHQLLIGEYELTIKKSGYETYKTKIVIDPTRQMEVDVPLTARTRFKAGIRSLVIPGWGQRYSGKQTRGFMYSGLALGSAVFFMLVNDDYNSKKDDYDRLDYDWLHASSQDEQRNIQPYLDKAREDAYDAETRRRLAFGILAGVWVVNVLDAVFLFPEPRGMVSVKGITLAPEFKSDQVGLTLTKSF